MFDEILNLVKEHMAGNPQVANAIPANQQDEVHQEIANQVNTGLQSQVAQQGGVGGLLTSLQNSIGSGNPVTSAIEGGLISSLGSRFGLSPAATGAIAAALPGLLAKFAGKAKDPNDSSISMDSITSALSGGGLGSLFNR